MSVTFSGGWESIIAKIHARQERVAQPKSEVKAGILGSAESDLPVIAATLEYGSPSKNIPARPFMRQALHDPKLAATVARIAELYYSGKTNLATSLERVGLASVAAIQEAIGSNIPPPNAPATIAAKGSSRTLIDTGRMRQSIHYEVVSK